VPCYFIHGNRDFLLGKRYARESGMQLLPEEKCSICMVARC
jgi:UDP-2,3-diacylglucosamine hydrolase